MAAKDTAALAIAESGAVFCLLATSRVLLAATRHGAVAVATAASTALAAGDFNPLGATRAQSSRDFRTILDAPLPALANHDPAVPVMVTDPCCGLLWFGQLGVTYMRLTYPDQGVRIRLAVSVLDGSVTVFLHELQAFLSADGAFGTEMNIIDKEVAFCGNLLLHIGDALVEVGDHVLGNGGTRHTAGAVTLPVFMSVVLDGKSRRSDGK